MRVTLFHNPESGEGVSSEALRVTIESHGHAVVHTVSPTDDAQAILDAPADLVVAAGGDGTVATAARVLARRGVPLALLPMGTANNIATSLGVAGAMDELIGRWSHATRRAFDLGRASGPWGERWFVEGVGGGLIARSIAAFESEPAERERPRREELIDAVRMHSEVLSSLKASHWEMTVDGQPVSGDYLLVAVLNIRLVGPNLELCPHADPSDGAFSVVLAGEEHREALNRHLDHRTEERDTWLGIPCRRANRVEMERGDLLHIDDAVFQWPEAGRVVIQVEPAALKVLI